MAHYQYLSEREQNTRRFRHDFKSHMAMAKQLYEEGKQGRSLKSLFSQDDRADRRHWQSCDRQHIDIADAIINRYYDEAALAGITMEGGKVTSRENVMCLLTIFVPSYPIF